MSQTYYQPPERHSADNPSKKAKTKKILINRIFAKNLSGVSAQTSRSANKREDMSSFNLQTLETSRKDQSFYRLPTITDLISMRPTHIDPKVHEAIIEVTKYAQNLELVINSKDKEIERLETIIKYLTAAHQSKEQMLTHTLQENRRLKEMPFLSERRQFEDKIQIKKIIADGSSRPGTAKRIINKSEAFRHPNKLPDEITPAQIKKMAEPKDLSPLIVKASESQTYRYHNERKNVSILKMNEKDIKNFYSENDIFIFLDGLLKSEEHFLQEMKGINKDKLVKVYEAMYNLKADHATIRDMTFKLRRIIKATISMTTSLMLDESIENIVEEICECLSCDRATIFMYDNVREELWSKAAKGSEETIRIPLNKGIVGYVFTNQEPLIIHNAYMDDRFNKAVDLRTGYKTNTILAVPIIDDNDKVIGVAQAVNKKGQSTMFNKDDESLLTILSNLAGVILRNSMTYNEQLSFHNTLRAALKVGIHLNSLHDLKHLLPASEKKLKSLMRVEKIRIVLKHPTKDELFNILQNGEYQRYPLDCGIMGKVIKEGEYENIADGYGHPLFNGLVDIETSLPLLCIPLKHPKTNEVLGAIQVINVKGVQGLTALKRPNIDALDKETLDFFCRNLTQAVINCYKWEMHGSPSKESLTSLTQEDDFDDFLPSETDQALKKPKNIGKK